jgi:hypothetical protein
MRLLMAQASSIELRVDQRAAAFQAGADDVAPRHAGQQASMAAAPARCRRRRG